MLNINKIKKYTKELSILLVEDHKELRDTTMSILQSLFKTVKSCENGQEALSEYLSYKKDTDKHYDIVLSDIEMPLMNGIDLTKAIYKENPLQCVIIISAFDESKYLLELINIGIEQFIKKPLDSQELLKSFLEAAKKLNGENIYKIQNKEIILSKDIIYSLDTKSLVNAGESIYLTKYEIIFIELLISSFGKIYTNEDIVSHYASRGESMEVLNIRKLVSKLRKKLPENSLESIYGIGYKFITLNT
ncbi:MAG: response regulator transcription factor [Sulfurimonas sp.]|nr:response regulator transcription factor [Sulfurimonas sp.]MDQ7061639.1 response regulator transcription factor [Sulfurimonas sp.]